jgi:hypothetical protein
LRGPPNATGDDTVDLELDQDGSDGSPLAGNGESCLAVTPAEGASLNLEASADWSTEGDNPDELHMATHEVEGSTTRAETMGEPGISASAGGIDTKTNVALELPKDSDAVAENLKISLTYGVEGESEATATTTCSV